MRRVRWVGTAPHVGRPAEDRPCSGGAFLLTGRPHGALVGRALQVRPTGRRGPGWCPQELRVDELGFPTGVWLSCSQRIRNLPQRTDSWRGPSLQVEPKGPGLPSSDVSAVRQQCLGVSFINTRRRKRGFVGFGSRRQVPGARSGAGQTRWVICCPESRGEAASWRLRLWACQGASDDGQTPRMSLDTHDKSPPCIFRRRGREPGS